MLKKSFPFLLCLFPLFMCAQPHDNDGAFVSANYIKKEVMIPMRDGVRLFTSIYIPKLAKEKYPFLMMRTPYSCAPYGAKAMKKTLGPDAILMKEKYIFVYQDVRGRYRSEGDFEEMTPAKEDQHNNKAIDESTDAFDTIEWLLHNITPNNGKAGIYGISYPGFYASASLPAAHPALKAVSPQAPVTDEFIGDDAYHNGAFFLMDNFDFTNYFQGTRLDSGTNYKQVFNAERKDAYTYFLNMGALKHTNDSSYFNHKAKIWDEYLQHNTYDDYWKARNIRPHFTSVKPAVLVVGGWFDAEDLFGALHTYSAIEAQNPGAANRLVMGPWTHGAWSLPTWQKFGGINFNENVNGTYQSKVEAPFFNYYLKGKGSNNIGEATIFETGVNEWKTFDHWPPLEARSTAMYFGEHNTLEDHAPASTAAYDEYISNPADPVPYIEGVYAERQNEYMVANQQFATARKDVLHYTGPELTSDMTVTGPVRARIFMSSSTTDADIIVKLIDVIPANADGNSSSMPVERLVRAEVFRCKFRNSYERPEALVPDMPVPINIDMNDIAHVFKKGHHMMVQVQSSWFPLVDMNPQQFLSIPECNNNDFIKANIHIYHDKDHASMILLPLLPNK